MTIPIPELQPPAPGETAEPGAEASLEVRVEAPDAVAERLGLEPVGRRPGWWVGPLYLAMAILLVPWVVLLAWDLPDASTTQNYRLAWVGFDVLLAIALARTAWMALRRSPFVVNTASATTALLVVDAWFDVVTSNRVDRTQAILAAVLVELPLAALSMLISLRAQREIARTGAVRQQLRWRRVRIPYQGWAGRVPPVPAVDPVGTP